MSGITSILTRSITASVVISGIALSTPGLVVANPAPAGKLEGGKEGLAVQYNPKELSVDKAVPSPSPSATQSSAQQAQGQPKGRPSSANWDLATQKK